MVLHARTHLKQPLFFFPLSFFRLHFRFLHEFKINRPVIAGSWGLSLSVFVSINLALQLFLSCHMSHTPLLSFTRTEHLRQMRWTIGWAHNVCTIRHLYGHKVTERPFKHQTLQLLFLPFCFALILCCGYSGFIFSFSFFSYSIAPRML